MKLRPLHPEFGAEVLEFDPLQNTISREDLAELRSAYDRYQLLLFRSLPRLTPDQQIAITGWFGEVSVNDGSACTVLHNEHSSGSRRLPFHSDLSYTDAPIKGISLQAIELPKGGTATAFVSGIAAWANLAPERQEQLSSLTLRHRYLSEHMKEWPEFIAEHSLCMHHPRTGDQILYATEHHADGIIGLDRSDSDELIAELFGHLYAPERVYHHRWKLNDLIIWDNLAVQHARPEEAEISRGIRAVQRVAISDVGVPELFEIARQKQMQREAVTAQ